MSLMFKPPSAGLVASQQSQNLSASEVIVPSSWIVAVMPLPILLKLISPIRAILVCIGSHGLWQGKRILTRP